MNYKQVEKHYGGATKIAQALGLKHKQTAHNWQYLKRIPSRWQIKIEALTGLKADRVARQEAADIACYLQRSGNGQAAKTA
jgi:hypothetical protein